MKKYVSFAISFLIIWALVTGGCYMIGFFSKSENLSDLSYDISIGLSGALGGAFGPMIAAYFRKLFSKNKQRLS